MNSQFKKLIIDAYTNLTTKVTAKCIPFSFYQPKAPKALTTRTDSQKS
ncbi:MAG: hypothetical protein Q8942_16125 [Bacillota bacterium]|nr:hypothetical protein [Bacillota bacterium]